MHALCSLLLAVVIDSQYILCVSATAQATIGIDFLSKTMYLEDRTVRLQVCSTIFAYHICHNIKCYKVNIVV